MKMEAIGFNVDASVVTNRLKVSLAKVRSRALATLARRLPVEARREIQQEYNLKAARIRAGLSVRTSGDTAILRGASRGINLIAFDARAKARTGVSVRVRKDGAASVHPHAFIASGRGGNRLVFERRGKSRLPLEALYGPSVGQMLKHGQRPQKLADYASQVVASELARLTR